MTTAEELSAYDELYARTQNFNPLTRRSVKFIEEPEQPPANNEIKPGWSDTVDEDEDIAKVSEELNIFSNGFKREILNKLVEMKINLAKKYNAKLEKMTLEKEELILENKLKMDKMQDSIAKRDQHLLKFKGLTMRLAKSVSLVREKRNNERELRKMLRAWSEYTKRKKLYKRMVRFSAKKKERTLMKKVFDEWRIWSKTSKFNNANLVWETKVQSTAGHIRNDYEIKIEKLEQELALAQQRVRDESKERMHLQENLKKALMRGVCALNNKFLEIMKDTNSEETEESIEQSMGEAPVPVPMPTVHSPTHNSRPSTPRGNMTSSKLPEAPYTRPASSVPVPSYKPYNQQFTPASCENKTVIHQVTVLRERPIITQKQPKLSSSTRKRPATPKR